MTPSRTTRPVPIQFLDWIESAPELYWCIDQDGKYTFLNAAWENLLGYSVEEMLGQSFLTFQPAEDRSAHLERVSNFAANPTAIRIESTLIRKDGSRVKVFFSCKPILEAGEMRGFYGMGFDLTAIRDHEARLEMNQTQLESFISLAPTAIAIFDTQLRYLAYSERWLEDYGLQGQSLKGRHHYDVFPSIQDNEDWKKIHRRGLDGETLVREEDTFIGADGQQEWLRWVVRPWYSRPDVIGGILMLTESITARRRAEIALRNSEERYRQLFDLGFEGIFVHENDVIVACNQATVDMLGYSSKEDIVGQRGADLIVAPESRPLILQRIQTKNSGRLEVWCKKKDGTRILIETQAREIDFLGRRARLVAIRDITAQRKAETDLRASEERYRQLAESAFEAILIHDKGVILDVNQAFLDMFGFPNREAIVGKDGRPILFTPSTQVKVQERYEQNITGIGEYPCLRQDGSQFIALMQTREIDYHGKIARLVTLRDITEIRKHQDELAAEKERLRVTLHSIGDGVIATDTQGRIRMMNTVAEQLTGFTQAQAEGLPLNEVFHIIHEYTRKACENPVDKVLTTGDIIELANHTLLVASDGSERIIADSGAPIRDAQNQIVGVVLVFRDTTEKHKLINAAQRSQKLESLGILAGGIAHDFNNLLGGIFGYVDIAHSKSRDSQITHPLEKALATIDRARGLTQQLLTFAKGGAPIRKAAWLFPFVEDTVRFIMSGSTVGCRFVIEPNLPASYFDRNQIGQVIDNLTINAQQAMPLGGTFTVNARKTVLQHNQVEGLPAHTYLQLSFSDTGIGIPAEIITRVFDPFFTTKQKGSGLGLATTYSILKQHDGGIEVESETGKGTTFHVYLPVSLEQPADEGSTNSIPEKGQGLVYLMDDEEVIRETIGAMLGDQGFAVQTFSEGQSLLDHLSAKPSSPKPVAIILDLTVPGGKGGRDIASELRQRLPQTPIIVSSGYADDPIMAEPQRYGISASLSKPFRRKELLAVMQKLLNQ